MPASSISQLFQAVRASRMPIYLCVVSGFFLSATTGTPVWATNEAAASPGTVNIPLQEILKPKEDSLLSREEHSSGNIMQWMMNILFVVGLVALILKQPWFMAWASRARDWHESGNCSPWQACLKALQKDNHTNPPKHTPHPTGPYAAHGKQNAQITPEALAPFEQQWCEYLKQNTLPGGTVLTLVRLFERYYVLTETAGTSHWLTLPDDPHQRSNAPQEQMPVPAHPTLLPHQAMKALDDMMMFPPAPPKHRNTAASTPDEDPPFNASLSAAGSGRAMGVTTPALPKATTGSSSSAASLLPNPAPAAKDILDARSFFARHTHP
jgi:hypothetical protein